MWQICDSKLNEVEYDRYFDSYYAKSFNLTDIFSVEGHTNIVHEFSTSVINAAGEMWAFMK